MSNPNPAAALASPTMQRIWSEPYWVETERDWWVTVMRAQKAQGLDIPDSAIKASQAEVLLPIGPRAKQRVLDRIREREFVTKHDVKARLEIFCEDAGHEYHHLGLTSADVVENVWQILVKRSITYLAMRYDLDASHLDDYVLRGIHGAVGTDQDQLDLLGSGEAIHRMNAWVCQVHGFLDYARSVPQVMHRSADLAVMTPVVSQVHRRAPERSPWAPVINGYVTMLANISGETWNEGDVSTSVVRRVALPNLLLTLDCAFGGRA